MNSFYKINSITYIRITSQGLNKEHLFYAITTQIDLVRSLTEESVFYVKQHVYSTTYTTTRASFLNWKKNAYEYKKKKRQDVYQ